MLYVATTEKSELMSSEEAALEAAQEIASREHDPFIPVFDPVDRGTAAATFKALSQGSCQDPGDVVKAIVCLYDAEELPRVINGLFSNELAMSETAARFFLGRIGGFAAFGVKTRSPEFLGYALAGVLDDFTPNVARLLRAHFD